MRALRRWRARRRLARALPQARGRALDAVAMDRLALARSGWRERLPLLGDRRFRRRINALLERQGMRPGAIGWARATNEALKSGWLTREEAEAQLPIGITLVDLQRLAEEAGR